MKFTLAWLEEHLETAAEASAIAERLTMLGLEVEGVRDRAAALKPFVVGYVVEAARHPNADKLSVCRVDTGREVVQVVCGAPNARTGMKGVFAPVGTRLPGTGLDLAAAEIRGVASNGMLCSKREMGLGDDHTGIIELPDDAPVGAPFAQALGLDDPVFDVSILPNRPDCLGVRGIARDLAAAGLGTLKPREIAPVPGAFQSPVGVELRFDEATRAACPMFVGRYVRGVKNGPSPRWLRDRLHAIGENAISALVDMTNFVTFDRSRPLHVFDADKLQGNIHARLSRPGERVLALNGKEYVLDDKVTVIADDSGALALGGVIGGETTGCTEATTNVFIEAALFDPVRTAATGRRHAIDSEARHRFERGVDPDFVCPGMELATRMVLDLCGGEPSEPVVAGAAPEWRRTIGLRPERVYALGGLDLPADRSAAILGRLGFDVERADGVIRAAVPSWRTDIEGEADLVEEVTRVHGFDAVPAVPLARATPVTRGAVSRGDRLGRIARRCLAARGMNECVTWSFLSRRHAVLFGGGGEALMLANPISADLDTMRPGLLPNLIAAAGRNMNRGFDDLALFEVGPAYADDTPQGQSRLAGGVRRGQSGPRHWTARPRPVDAHDAKADAEAVLGACGAPVGSLQVFAEAPAWYHSGRAGTLRLGPKTVLAAFGELHPGVLAALDVRGPLAGFEVMLDAIPAPRAKGAKTRPKLELTDLPDVARDFAFVVDAGVPAGELRRAALGADKTHVAEAVVFDVFEGEALGAGKKSVAIAVRLRPVERTFTEAQIEAVAKKIVAAVAKATGGTLRGEL